MPTRYRVVLAAALAGLAFWLAAKHRHHAEYFWKLYQARRLAERFYAECPTVFKNITYHSSTHKTLDVYRPESGDGHPVIVYVYGGSWFSGNKELYAPAAQRLLPHGTVIVIPDYTLFPAGGYPRQTQEAAAALAWTLDNIQRFGGDPARVVVAAQSAGAQIAALALLDPQFLAAHNHSPTEVRGFIGISGVYDIQTQLAHERRQGRPEQYVVNVMGGRQNLVAASPLHFVGRQAPAALLIHGDADGTVPVRMSHDLHAALQAAGAQSELRIYPGAGHSSILFDALAQNPSRLLTEMVGFVRRCTEPNGRTGSAPTTQLQTN